MSSRLILGLLVVPLLLACACSSQEVQQASDTVAPPNPYDISLLRNALDANNLTVTASQTATEGVFSRMAEYMPLEAAGRPLQAYLFSSEKDARAAAAAVRKDGRTIEVQGGPVPVRWGGEPHFFLRDRLMTVYVSEPSSPTATDVEILRVLNEEMGAQFAGSE
jgi:hypothetical protein